MVTFSTKDNDFFSQPAYWLCSQCIDVDWTPPRELDFSSGIAKSLTSEDRIASPSTSRRPENYVAPLTQLVTADNQVASDAVRSSPALFFDEPSYATTTSGGERIPANDAAAQQYDHHYSDEEAWEPAYADLEYQSTERPNNNYPDKSSPGTHDSVGLTRFSPTPLRSTTQFTIDTVRYYNLIEWSFGIKHTRWIVNLPIRYWCSGVHFLS